MSSKNASTPVKQEDILADDGVGDAPAATKPKVNYGKEFLHCAGNNDKKRVVEIIEMGKRSGDDYINYQSKIGNSGLHQAAVSVKLLDITCLSPPAVPFHHSRACISGNGQSCE